MRIATLARTTALAVILAITSQAHAAYVITGGSVTMEIQEGASAVIGFLDSYFDETATRSDILNVPPPGNATITRLSGSPGTSGYGGAQGAYGDPGLVQVIDPIRPYGQTVANTDGRSRRLAGRVIRQAMQDQS